MNLRSIFRSLCLLWALSLYPTTPDPLSTDYLDSFYEQYIAEAKNKIPVTPSTRPDALRRFTNQHFMLWDYLIHVDESGYVSHFQDVLTMLQNRKMKRLIVFIKDPGNNAFFDPGTIGENSFRGQITNIVNTMQAIQPEFYVSVFFASDGSSFTSSADPGTYPSHNQPPSNYLSGYFTYINNMLDWAKAMIADIPGIQEIAFDPEYPGATKVIQQRLYNYADEYKYENGLESIKLATTLGIDEAPETYSNLSTFPVPALFRAGNIAVPSGSSPDWRVGNANPLLQTVYIQCYQTSIPAMFAAGATANTASHDGQLAGSYFNHLLRNQPYLDGQGTISFTQGNTTITGQGTNFLSFADPILFAPDPNLPNEALNKVAVVSSVNSNTSLTSTAAAFTNSNVSFRRTEIATAWNELEIAGVEFDEAQNIVDNIVWMFSLNYNSPFLFFGNWELNDFMNFITTVVTNNNKETTAPFRTQDGRILTFPSHNFAIYNFFFATTTVNGGGPPYNNVTINWNLLSSDN